MEQFELRDGEEILHEESAFKVTIWRPDFFSNKLILTNFRVLYTDKKKKIIKASHELSDIVDVGQASIFSVFLLVLLLIAFPPLVLVFFFLKAVRIISKGKEPVRYQTKSPTSQWVRMIRGETEDEGHIVTKKREIITHKFAALLACILVLGGVLLGFAGGYDSDGKDNLPACTSEEVISAAIEAVEDANARAGIFGSKAKVITKITNALKNIAPYSGDDLNTLERNMARAIGYGPEHVRICSAPQNEKSTMTVIVGSSPKNIDQWVVAVTNIVSLSSNIIRDVESIPRNK